MADLVAAAGQNFDEPPVVTTGAYDYTDSRTAPIGDRTWRARRRSMPEATHAAPAGHAAPAHHGHRSLQHQFDTLEQQKEASTLGMWLFLATEIMFFGGLFCIYLIYRRASPLGFAEAATS